MCINELEFIPQFTNITTVSTKDVKQEKIVFCLKKNNHRALYRAKPAEQTAVKIRAGYKTRVYNYTAKPLSLISALTLP